MATPQEKEALIDNIKGPRYYRVSVYGYGGESAYIELNKTQYDFWSAHTEEHGDYDLVQYMLGAEDGDYDFDDLEELPDDVKFLSDGEHGSPWYEAPTEVEHQYGTTIGDCRMQVEEVSSEEYDANVLNEVLDSSDVLDWAEENGVEVDFKCTETKEPKYVVQMYSSEKGSFFDGVIKTVGEFDPAKMKIYTTEYWNGDDTIESIEYEGVDIDNSGGDTNGKGYSAHLWTN